MAMVSFDWRSKGKVKQGLPRKGNDRERIGREKIRFALAK